MTKKNIFKIFFYLFVTFGLLSFIVFIPSFREKVICFAENFVGRALTHEVWHERFVRWEILFLFWACCGALSCFLIPKIHFSGEKTPLFEKCFSSKSSKWLLCVLLIFISISSIRIYWMNQKIDFHADELFSIGIANRNKELSLWGSGYLELDREYTGLEIKEKAMFDEASVSDSVKDVVHLWINNEDPPHPSLYYMLFRLWFTGVKTHDFKTIFIRGSLLNFVFFCFSFFFMFKLLSLVTERKITIAASLFSAFCNPASVGISVFLRPYAMQETALILFFCLFIRYFTFFSNGIVCFSKSLYIKSILIVAFVFSSDYFSPLFIVFLGFLLLLYLFRKKDSNGLCYFISMVLVAFVITKCCYLLYGDGLLYSNGSGSALNRLKDSEESFLSVVQDVLTFISESFFYFWVILISLAVSLFLSRKNVKDFSYNAIPVVAILWMVVIMPFSLSPILRYIAPAFSLLPLAFAFPFACKKKWLVFIFAIQVLISVFIVKNTVPLQSNFSKIEHLDDNGLVSNPPEYAKHPEIPVIMRQKALQIFIYPYVHNEQKYYAVESRDDADSLGFAEYFYIDATHGGFSEEFVSKKIQN